MAGSTSQQKVAGQESGSVFTFVWLHLKSENINFIVENSSPSFPPLLPLSYPPLPSLPSPPLLSPPLPSPLPSREAERRGEVRCVTGRERGEGRGERGEGRKMGEEDRRGERGHERGEGRGERGEERR